MKAAVYLFPGRHHESPLRQMSSGLQRHGIEVAHFKSDPAPDADFVVVWSWRLGLRIKGKGLSKPILVMERGYIGDRFQHTSLGWDGLNGRARFPDIDDPSRWEESFAYLMQPWREPGGYALVAGQVRGDTALKGVNIFDWYADVTGRLRAFGWDVRFRQHPVEIERGYGVVNVPGAKSAGGPLKDAFAGAGLVCTFNSNLGVDALLAGVPVHAEDEGSMVYPIVSHDLMPRRPERETHFHRMAWCQWSPEEIASGEAWEVVRTAMPVA